MRNFWRVWGWETSNPNFVRSFLAYMYEWVQSEIGDRLTDGLSDEQVAEFGR
ncbi:MAG: hypothetical protein U0P48_11485 [Ancrocorticia sp.]